MIKTIIKAFIIGATMMVPGLSGGSMAMVLSIYKDLIYALSEFRKNIKENFIFLAVFSIAGICGMFLLARPIMLVINRFPVVSMYFFLGLVVGSIPTIYKEAKVDKIGLKDISSFIVGMAIVIAIGFLPEGLFAVQDMSFAQVIIHIIGGFLVSIGFILPGISVSYLLLVLGIYSFIMDKISTLDVISLIPFAVGFCLGCLIMVKALSKALANYPRISYLVIFGFLVGSLIPVFPGLPATVVEWILSIILFALGCVVIYFFSKAEKSKEIENSSN